MTGQELMELAGRVDEQWKDDPNVIGVGFGIKERGGQWVPGPTLCFTVRRKLATEEEIRAAGSKPIPHDIEGVSTDVNVIEAVPTQFTQLPMGSRGTHIEEPLKGGVSTSVLGSFLSFPTGYGTLGSVCLHNDGRLMALSNAHVWGYDLGDDIVQPLLPVGEFVEAGVKLLTCGPIISFLAEGRLPSGLTGVLTVAAAGAWIAAAASDAKDPHRRGQEATVPVQPDERTIAETVRFAAEPKDLPLPGTPFQADVSWEYTRQTDRATYSFAVNETRVNEHVLVRKHIWTAQPQYDSGQVVEIMALLESPRPVRPDSFHVVAHLASASMPERRISRVLHPATCDTVPYICVKFPQHQPDSEAQFPISQQGITFRADRPGMFRDWWPQGSPDRQVELQFPGEGMEIDVPTSSRAEVHVVQFNPEPIVLEAYDAEGTQLDTRSTPGTQSVEHVLAVEGPAITRLVLRGGQNEGLLLLLCVTLFTTPGPDISIQAENHIFCYRGRYTLDGAEPPGPWSALLSAQTVNTVPPGTPPIDAAGTIGGLESAATATGLECVIVLALDHLFDVI